MTKQFEFGASKRTTAGTARTRMKDIGDQLSCLWIISGDLSAAVLSRDPLASNPFQLYQLYMVFAIARS
jgi:hypothetical protein